eukprot:scaffold1071_cov328-Pavlova_lutheri.AAC.2
MSFPSSMRSSSFLFMLLSCVSLPRPRRTQTPRACRRMDPRIPRFPRNAEDHVTRKPVPDGKRSAKTQPRVRGIQPSPVEQKVPRIRDRTHISKRSERLLDTRDAMATKAHVVTDPCATDDEGRLYDVGQSHISHTAVKGVPDLKSK